MKKFLSQLLASSPAAGGICLHVVDAGGTLTPAVNTGKNEKVINGYG